MNSLLLLKNVEDVLNTAEAKTARLDALAIIEHVTGKNKALVLAGFVVNDVDVQNVQSLATARASGAPLAYLLGEKEFFGRTFFVNSSVLIPRPESEDMISIALALELPVKTNIIDVGTGSGILGITYALEKNLELASSPCLFLGDISPAALTVAKRNARAHKVSAQYLEADLLEDTTGFLKDKSDGLILANLPYVPDYLVTSVEIRSEPELALFSGIDGLAHYERFFKEISALQSKPIHVIIESLPEQFDDLDEFASLAGYRLSFRAGLASCFSRISGLSQGAHA